MSAILEPSLSLQVKPFDNSSDHCVSHGLQAGINKNDLLVTPADYH